MFAIHFTIRPKSSRLSAHSIVIRTLTSFTPNSLFTTYRSSPYESLGPHENSGHPTISTGITSYTSPPIITQPSLPSDEMYELASSTSSSNPYLLISFTETTFPMISDGDLSISSPELPTTSGFSSSNGHPISRVIFSYSSESYSPYSHTLYLIL